MERHTHTDAYIFILYFSQRSPPRLSFPLILSPLLKLRVEQICLAGCRPTEGASCKRCRAGFNGALARNRGYNEVGAEKRRKYCLGPDETAVASAGKTMGWSAGMRVLTRFDVTLHSRFPLAATAGPRSICFSSTLLQAHPSEVFVSRSGSAVCTSIEIVFLLCL